MSNTTVHNHDNYICFNTGNAIAQVAAKLTVTYFSIYALDHNVEIHYNECLILQFITTTTIQFSVSSWPPQSQRCWLITQWVIAITNSTLLGWLRSACCRNYSIAGLQVIKTDSKRLKHNESMLNYSRVAVQNFRNISNSC